MPGTEERDAGAAAQEITKEVPTLYAQDGAADPIAYVHLFSCLNGWE